MYPVRQWSGICRQGRAGLDQGCRLEDRLHHAGKPMGEWLHRELQRAPARRAAGRRDLLLIEGSSRRRGELATSLQHQTPTWMSGIQTASARSVRPCLCDANDVERAVSDTGRSGPEAHNALTFAVDPSLGADHMSMLKALNIVALPKLIKNDPLLQRRVKLLTQLEQQRELAANPAYSVLTK